MNSKETQEQIQKYIQNKIKDELFSLPCNGVRLRLFGKYCRYCTKNKDIQKTLNRQIETSLSFIPSFNSILLSVEP